MEINFEELAQQFEAKGQSTSNRETTSINYTISVPKPATQWVRTLKNKREQYGANKGTNLENLTIILQEFGEDEVTEKFSKLEELVEEINRELYEISVEKVEE